MPDNEEPQNPADSEESSGFNAAEALDAMGGGARPLVFSRVGGGKGPGWSGDYYMNEQCQIGIAGSFTGETLEQILTSLAQTCGGGCYTWSGTDSKGKPKRCSQPIYIPGRPLPLPSVHDPAAEDQREWADQRRAEGRSPTQGAFSAMPGPVNPEEAAYVDNQWMWAPTVGRYVWFSSSGLQPPCPPPRHAPGAGAFGHYRNEDPDEPPKWVKELVKPVMEVLADKKKDGEGKGFMDFMIAQMKMQNDKAIADAAAARADAESRWNREIQMKRDADAQALALEKERIRLQEKQMQLAADAAAAAKPQSLKDKIEELDMIQGIREKPETEEKDDKNDIGKKVVDGFSNLASLAKTYFEDRREERKKNPPKNQAQNGGNGHAQGGGGDENTEILRQWTALLEHAEDCYQNKFSPQRTMEGVTGVVRGLGIELDTLIAQMSRHGSIDEILGLLSLVPDGPEKQRLQPVIRTFSTSAGQAWFDQLLAHVKSIGRA